MITKLHGWHLQAGARDRAWLESHARGFEVTIRDRGADTCLVALQGPVCLPLYGNEIDETTDPLSAGLTRAAVSLEGHDFIGRKALAALALKKPAQVMSGFEMVEPGVPRFGCPIFVDGRTVGRVTTGLFSSSTGKYLGMGYVEVPRANVGEEVGIVISEAVKTARIVKRPFYTSPHWR